MGVILSVRGVSRIQRHVNRDEVATTSPPFCRFNLWLWKLHLSWPSHPGHSIILLQSGSPSGKYAKLRTVAASSNRDHAPRSLYYCLFAPYMQSDLVYMNYVVSSNKVGLTRYLDNRNRKYKERNSFLSKCLIWVLFFAHIPFVVLIVWSESYQPRFVFAY